MRAQRVFRVRGEALHSTISSVRGSENPLTPAPLPVKNGERERIRASDVFQLVMIALAALPMASTPASPVSVKQRMRHGQDSSPS
ncbi:hypothetical protein V1282_007315 [Nitrobacteraceae bacterium AZCC 2146]